MNKKQRNKRDEWPLLPEEWDFEEVELWEVNWALRHEYSRECTKEMEALGKLVKPDIVNHATGIGLAYDAALNSGVWQELEQWKRKWGKFYRLNEFLAGALRQAFHPNLVIAMETACRVRLDFRKPWMSQRNEILPRLRRTNHCVEKVDFVRLVSWSRCPDETSASLEFQDYLQWCGDSDVGHYVLHINWALAEAKGVDEVYAQLRKQLAKLRPIPTRIGRRAATPYDELRALAAWRLSTKAGLSFDQASALVNRRAEEIGVDLAKEARGLPYYTSETGWKKAIKRADFLIKNLQKKN